MHFHKNPNQKIIKQKNESFSQTVGAQISEQS